jgi:transposase InsO family protein
MKYLVKRELKIDLSTTLIYRFYCKKGLIRKKQKRLPWYQPMKNRISTKESGQNIQLDVQYIWQNGIFIYRFRFVDDYSRMQFFSDQKSKDSVSAIRALEKAKQYFPFKIQSIQTDNGAENRGNFHQYLIQNNITHHFIPKASAPWNGKVERAHGVMNQEYFNSQFQEPQQYLEWYNYERIHLGINGLTPYEKYLESVTP